ncbi:hypothetical protein [Microbacterium wangruii]|uniref:hypothetical protein n=1 Tax=Microbacterium wangruii TaxID=3049073 RepID=UPI00256EC408|nr:hypothetical protein [Microbacterium sp. zg-Y1211]MDL5487692.1 hypothetical protein [Microbacterium sp. zg-Y1211]
MTSPHPEGQAPTIGAPTPPPHQTRPADPAPTPGGRPLNVLGLAALIAAVVGTVLACIPGIMFVGWILLPIAFVVGIVSLFRRGQGKALGIAALITSAVGTIIGFIAFFIMVGFAVTQASEEPETARTGDVVAVAETSRDEPLPWGTTVAFAEWDIAVNSVTAGQTDAVLAENAVNAPPAEGYEYVLANLTVTYTGDADEGEYPSFVVTDYLPAGGEPTDVATVTVPDGLGTAGPLVGGETRTGNVALLAPVDASEGDLIAVKPGIAGDAAYFPAG